MSRRASSNEELVAALAELEGEDQPPDHSPAPADERFWEPDLNPTQKRIFNDPSKFILGHGEKGCRTLDTMIYTASGLKRLGRMRPERYTDGFNPLSVDVMSAPDQVATADAYWHEPDPEAIRAELSHGGEMTGSPRHPIWTCWEEPSGEWGFGWKKLEEMEPLLPLGWRFWTPIIGHNRWSSRADGVSQELSYALGALVGDGGLNFDTGDNRSVGFTNIDQECISAVSDGLSQIGARLSGSRLQYNVIPAKSIKPLLRQMGLVGLTHEKRIPDAIIESGKSACAAFLSGLFDTDGTVDKAGNVQLCTTSEKLGLDVQDMLAAFGILCVRRSKKTTSGNPTWTLSVMGRNAFKFGREIGFKISRKQNRIIAPKPSLKNPNGFNSNRYGFPNPIRYALKSVALKSRSGNRSRSWHNGHRHLHSFGSVPQRPKVDSFCQLYGCGNEMSGFLISDTWVEVVGLSRTSAQLGDLHVPNGNSFMAAGTWNHNTGKSIGFLHKIVRHCYENSNAFVLIIAPSIRTGADGVVHDLENLVLPAWKEGNREPAHIYADGKMVSNPRSGELMDDGIGLEYTPFKPEFDTKDRVMWVANKHGGWSKVKLISIPYAEAIEGRIKGPAPSMVYVEELTDLDDISYFRLPAAQLGRRRGISGPQQWCASCNPKGPSHWVYKHFFHDILNPETGEKDSDYSIYHVPIHENIHRLPAGYTDSLQKIFKSDPILKRRLLDGEWIDMPTGEALFKEFFSEARHVVGSAPDRTGINPIPGVTVTISMDLGQVNSAAIFQQCVPTKDGLVWLAFDEVVHLNKKILYRQMAREIVDRMKLWEEAVGQLNWEIVTGTDTVNQWRPGHGDYDATIFERAINEYLLREGRKPIKVNGVPNGEGMVSARVRLTQDLLSQDRLFVSAMCPKLKEALMLVEGDPKKPMHPKKTAGGYDHSFDAASYGYARVEFGGRPISSNVTTEEPVKVLLF